MISKVDIERIYNEANIHDFFPECESKGKNTQYVRCPACGAEGKGKGLAVTHIRNEKVANIAKCFQCGFGTSLYKHVMTENNCSFPEAVKKVADRYGIALMSDDTRAKGKTPNNAASAPAKRSFRNRQLDASGLSEADCLVPWDSGFICPFEPGSMTYWGDIETDKDDMIIRYFDLDGNPIIWKAKPSAKQREYIRVRFAMPEQHGGVKYMTAKGARSQIYIPQRIRDLRALGRDIPTLIVQEGEKKAEKACKHKIPSVAIQGIQNTGTVDTGIFGDLARIVTENHVRRIVLLFDSDWQSIGNNPQPGDEADRRPKNFLSAAMKFRQYAQSIYKDFPADSRPDLDIYVGAIRENPKNDKGIDDLLTNTLKGREDELVKDLESAFLAHDLKGQWVELHNVTAIDDGKFERLWGLNYIDDFFKLHKEQLTQLGTFRFKKAKYMVENGKPFKVSRFRSERKIYSTFRDDKDRDHYNFDYIEAREFLKENGYWRIRTSDCTVGQSRYSLLDNNIIKLVGTNDIRRFILSYIEDSTSSRDIQNYFYAKITNLMSDGQMEFLHEIKNDFDIPTQDEHTMVFNNGAFRITAHSTQHVEVGHPVWEDKVIKRDFQRVPLIADVVVRECEGEEYARAFDLTLTPAGERCEFLTFLRNTSSFWGRTREFADENQRHQHARHLLSKLTAIGYLVSEYKYDTENKCVIAMDSTLSDVGVSKGRSGKSLIGLALKHIMSQVLVDGKKLDNAQNKFIFSSVTERTRNVFIDDVRTNFDFESLYSALTTDLEVNVKQGTIFTIPYAKAPKIYLTTNHAINDQNDSAKDRKAFILFSDWYNVDHKPADDFGHQLFSDWDAEQWCLFDNLMVECVMLYLRCHEEGWDKKLVGLVSPPMTGVELRTARQIMGNEFFEWAEAYFDESRLNTRFGRKALIDAFTQQYNSKYALIASQKIKDKLAAYCTYKGYHLNPHKLNKDKLSFSQWRKIKNGRVFIGDNDPSNSEYYFIIATEEWAERNCF